MVPVDWGMLAEGGECEAPDGTLLEGLVDDGGVQDGWEAGAGSGGYNGAPEDDMSSSGGAEGT